MMVGDWVKIKVTLSKDPKVIAIAAALARAPQFWMWASHGASAVSFCRDISVTCHVTESVTVASLLQIWGVTRRDGVRDGDDIVLTHSTLATLDRICEVPGFGEAMRDVGWVVVQEGDRLLFPKLVPNILSPEERERELAADRKRRQRERERDKASDMSRIASRQCPTEVTPREEKSREEKKEPPKPPIGGIETPKSRSRKADVDIDDPRFERFWDAFANKVGRQDAIRAWLKRQPSDELVEQILEAIKRQRVAFRWGLEGGKFQHNPATWLNGRRWEDETPPIPGEARQPTEHEQQTLQAIIEKQRARARENDELAERSARDMAERKARQAQPQPPLPADEEDEDDEDDAPPPF